MDFYLYLHVSEGVPVRKKNEILDYILWGWKFKILENRKWVDFGFRANVCIPAKNYLMGLWKLKIKQSRHGGVLDTK